MRPSIAMLLSAGVVAASFAACTESADLCDDYAGAGTCVSVKLDKNDPTTSIQEALLAAQPGQEIRLPEGRYNMTSELTITQDGVTIRGAGRYKTLLDFSGQLAGAGASGIKAEAIKGIAIEDLAVLNTTGDGIVAIECEDVIFRNLRVEWERGADAENGLYGLYPVRSTNILIEGTEVRGSSDAGIYVGESNYAIVRNNNAWENVSAIQIENTYHSEVYDNTATNNTLGIFVFDLPNKLSNKNGGFHLIRNNVSRDNNEPNFADASQIAGDAPAGTGILVMATRNVEIRDNTVENNKGLGIGVVSYHATLRPISDEQYYPFPLSIYIHDNTITGGGTDPLIPRFDGKIQDVSLAVSLFFTDDDGGYDVPELLIDGVFPPITVDTGTAGNRQDICFQDNGTDGGAAADFASLNLGALGVTDPTLTFDELVDRIEGDQVQRFDADNPFECEGIAQHAVDLPF